MIDMEKMEVLRNLKNLIGMKPMEICELYNEVIVAFGDFEEGGETEVLFNESHNAGYDYSAYINAEDSTQFLFLLDKEQDEYGDILYAVRDVWEA